MKIRRWMMVGLLAAASCANCPCAPQDDRCEGDSECAEGQVCRNNACVGRGRACLVDDECDQDSACLNGFCEVGQRNTTDAGPQDAGFVAECQQGQQNCQDTRMLRLCALGRFNTVDCSRNGLTCQADGCRPLPCGDDAGTRCLDLASVEDCSTGLASDCSATEVCWQARCALATGQPCSDDATCAGGACMCANGACPGTSLDNGYCTQLDCNTDGGNPCPLGDICMGLASAGGARQNACGARAGADCPTSSAGQGAGYVGPYQRFLPIPDPTNPERYTFGDAVCFDPDPRAVGAPCTAPADCMGGAAVGFGGQCLAAGNNGYCTHACDATHPCPPSAACIHRSADPVGAGVCALMCGQQRPGLATCNRSGVSCQMPGAAFSVLDGHQDALGLCWTQ